MKYALLSLLFFSLTIPLTLAQKAKQWLRLEVAPKISFTENLSWDHTYTKHSNPGMAFDAGIGYGRVFPKISAFAEISIGYASYRLSVEERTLDMYIGRHALSYQFRYLHGTAKFGFIHKTSFMGLTLAPYIGARYLFYLPIENISWDYHDVDINQYNSHDIIAARYRTVQAGGELHTFMLTAGIKLNIPLSKRFDFNLTPFGDLGFRPLRLNFYDSQQLYTFNQDVYTTNVATNKGDALGVEVGINYLLR